TPDLIIEGMQAAKKAGAVVSLDLNFRAKLWKATGSEKNAVATLQRIVENVDVLIGNEEDMQKGLGVKGPEVTSKTESKLDTSVFFGMIQNTVKQFPNLKAVATTLREAHSTNRHDWAAVLWLDGQEYTSPTCALDVVDRIGGGDGFAAGLIYGLISGQKAERALRLGWAHGALLTTFPGDVTNAKLAEVEAIADGGSARVQR
ncbi:MAG: PfkB family carbohydrate kinase, partial [Fimbriiglobus sp.]